MLEGLWVTRFEAPSAESHDILNGVVVIETGRILGGDSGFLYLGEIAEKSGDVWPVSVRIKRHDERVQSIFGDVDDYVLTGRIVPHPDASEGRFMIVLGRNGAEELLVSLTKAADLP